MKAVGDFQRTHAKYLLRGKFVDDEGITGTTGILPVDTGTTGVSPVQSPLVAKRFIADDGTSAVCVWNISNKPADVMINGLGKPTGVFAPGNESTTGQIRPDSLRLYVYGVK